MSKGRSVEVTLSNLAALRGMGAAAIERGVAGHLNSRTNLVVAKAAELAREAGLKSLVPQLVEAFGRLMDKPASSDKGCHAKQAIASALYEVACEGADVEQVFLTGIRHVQMEPAWGASTDTAAELRGTCALGLVRLAYGDVMNELVDLLMDSSHQARIMAARAIAYAGRDEGALLLRMKILAGDRDDNVTCECILALGKLAGAKSLPFLRKFLDSQNPAFSETAAMALGEMRHADALCALFEHWEGTPIESARKALLLPIALSRLPQSVEFLVGVIERASEALAAMAVESLRMYRHDSALKGRLAGVIERRNSAPLRIAMSRVFV
jgi:HEAT repeat protein